LKKKHSAISEWLRAVVFAVVVLILFRIFAFEAFTIPSASMEKSLLTGDYILVSKLSYGPRFPMTPLALPFAHQRMPFSEELPSYLDWIRIPYYRLFSEPDVERGDIIVFNYPMEEEHPVDQRTYYIKRCMALPGDTIEVRGGQVYVNGLYSDVPDKLQFNHKVTIEGDSINSDTIRSLGISQGGRMRNKNEFWFTLDNSNIQKIKTVNNVKDVSILLEKKGSYSDYMFPENEHYLWNVDYFGPLYVPKRGDTVRLTVDSLPLYERIISVYEGNTLRVSNDSIFINDSLAHNYVFKMNYYFMMGDNRHNSADSRFWGFLPEDHIVGKTVMILLSIDKKEEGSDVRSDRWFKAVD
jgi:signal peptidase I